MVLAGAAVSSRVRALERRNADLEEFAREADDTIQTLVREKDKDESTIKRLREQIARLKHEADLKTLEREQRAIEVAKSMPTSAEELKSSVIELTNCLTEREEVIFSLEKRLEVDGDVLRRKEDLEQENRHLKEEKTALLREIRNLTKHKQVSLETEEVLRESIAELERQLQLDEDPSGTLRLDEETKTEASGQARISKNARDCIETLCSFLPASLNSVRERVGAYFAACTIKEKARCLSRTSTQAVVGSMRDCVDAMTLVEEYLRSSESLKECSLTHTLHQLHDLICDFESSSSSSKSSVDMKLVMLREALAGVRKQTTSKLSSSTAGTMKDALRSVAADFNETISSSTEKLTFLQGKVALSEIVTAELSSQVTEQKKAMKEVESRAMLERDRVICAIQQADAASDLRVQIRAKQQEIGSLRKQLNELKETGSVQQAEANTFGKTYDLRQALRVACNKQWILQQQLMAYRLRDLQGYADQDQRSYNDTLKSIIVQQGSLKRAMANARVFDVLEGHTSGSACLRDAHKNLGFANRALRRSIQKGGTGSVHVTVTRGFLSAQQLRQITDVLSSTQC